MVDPSSEDDGALREWAPLSTLLSQIPPKAQRGLFTGDLNLTCIAALPDYLAIGTNHGLVYWYNRLTNELQRLRCENTVCAITCVAVTSTVDYMIAAGTSNGIVTVFLVPKASPDNIPELFKTNSKKQVERYTVADLHSAPISAVEWSQNGMKLFSGDQKGTVVLTEIDFYMHLSKSAELLNEKYEVVQLSYNSSNQLLLVSTLYRTILCHRDTNDGAWKVSQVGNKERKTLGKMGAVFFNNPENPRAPVAYCSRPGLRLWAANKDGVVEKTLMFKDSVQGQLPLIPLLNPTKSRKRQPQGEPQLGPVLMFKDNLIVTSTAEALLVLDPHTIRVVAALYDVQKISALCVSKSEIFILEGERHLMRIGFTPEDIPITSMAESTSTKSGALANQFLELTAKLKDTSITSVIPIKKLSPIFSPTKSSGSSDGEQISECMEVQELPPVLSLAALDPGACEGLPELRVSDSALAPKTLEKDVYTNRYQFPVFFFFSVSLSSDLLDQIAKEQFEDIVFQPKRRTKKNRNKRSGAPAGTESGSDTTSVVSATSENDELLSSERLDASSEWSNISMNTSRRSSVDTSQKNENGKGKPGPSSREENFSSWNEDLSKALEGSLDKPLVKSSPEEGLKTETFSATNSFNLEHCNEDAIRDALAIKERLLAKKYNLEAELGITFDEDSTPDDCKPEETSSQPLGNSNAAKECIADTSLVEGSEENTLQSLSGVDSLRSISDSSECFHDSTLSYGPPSGSSQLTSQHSSLDLEIPS
ncbi:hypothetical protein ONE63_004145 [Megalurothrips usitatus]|uniref:WD repeat-containing protein CG11141 n=1 Tax=Megalurothrips usitatus TaxID=439358 RepID=A0AAV7X648_9NEOP|nr:hypothetical protein ONE63_004145 [Megalurothrips usitatus]